MESTRQSPVVVVVVFVVVVVVVVVVIRVVVIAPPCSHRRQTRSLPCVAMLILWTWYSSRTYAILECECHSQQ
jgi:hypothetical protein